MELALTLLCMPGPKSEDVRERSLGGAILRNRGQLCTVNQARPSHRQQARDSRFEQSTTLGLSCHIAKLLKYNDNYRSRIVVGDGDGFKSEFRRAARIFLGVAVPGQECEVRWRVEFDEGNAVVLVIRILGLGLTGLVQLC